MLSELSSLPRRLVDGLDFAAHAWRGAWAIQLLAAAATAMVVAGWLSAGGSSAWVTIGGPACLVAWAPLFGALHQIERVERDRRHVIAFGLQLGPVELSLWICALSLVGVVVLMALGIAALCSMVLVAFGSMHPRSIGPIEIKPAFDLAVVILGVGCGLGFWFLLRLSLSWGLAVDGDHIALWRSWWASRNRTPMILGAYVVSVVPSLLLVAAAIVLDALGPSNMQAWPVSDAWLMGGCAGFLVAFVQAPVLVGVFGGLERRKRHRSRRGRSGNRSLFGASSL